ncbi:MAG TPA: hypothetical protein ENK39_04095 [Epsilonproteobacteria bacterium]|nr:hypothetical protein [Campylobacterota bacterium]
MNKELSLIPYVSEENATGEIKRVYDEIRGTFGMIPAPLKQHSVYPEVLIGQWQMMKEMVLNDESNFSHKLLAMMRMVVSSAPSLDCDYCVGFNESMLINMFGLTIEEINMIKAHPSSANLNEKDKKMLIYMIDATTKPKEINKAQIQELRNLGWSDKDIFKGIKLSTQMVAMTLLVDTLDIPRDF